MIRVFLLLALMQVTAQSAFAQQPKPADKIERSGTVCTSKLVVVREKGLPNGPNALKAGESIPMVELKGHGCHFTKDTTVTFNDGVLYDSVTFHNRNWITINNVRGAP